MQLKTKDWTRFWGKKAAPKVPERPSYDNFLKVTQDPHFLKKCKGRTKENFSKIAQKNLSFVRPKSTLAQMALSFNYYALKVQRLEKICKVTQNSHFLKHCKGGIKGNFKKIA